MRHMLAGQLVKARGGAGLDLYKAAVANSNPAEDDNSDLTYFQFAAGRWQSHANYSLCGS